MTTEIPDNDDVEPGNEPEPDSGREDGGQDDMSDPVPEHEQEQQPVGEPDDAGESDESGEG